jgi:acyl-CoA synthetase (AMP-forming)/AMP-acid ligase II/acyl carrier protein
MSKAPWFSRSNPTLVHVLRERAAERADARAFTFLVDGESHEAVLTFAQLDERARAIAAALLERGAGGKTVVLLFPPELEYVSAFFGCLYAGAIAVPAYPPDPMRLGRTLPRLQAIIDDAGADVVLTTSALLGMSEMIFQLAPSLRNKTWVATDEIDTKRAGSWQEPALSGDNLAFLQYTSGSTGSAKGVMLTHGILLSNLAMISRFFDQIEGATAVSWLPLYHDMGLIGAVLNTVCGGAHAVLLSPIDFLQRPVRWLQAIHRYRGQWSGGPNFAFDLCARKVTEAERKALDLSCWTHAGNGAEPVRADTLKRFHETFAECGLRPNLVAPVYGLAEATLMVSGSHLVDGPVTKTVDAQSLAEGRVELASARSRQTRQIIGCGEPVDDCVLIVDAQTAQPSAADRIGEVWVRGPHVAKGYWNKPEDTEATFGARLANGEGPFLRTGDHGIVIDGQLFITGRLKDLIIVRGLNYYPQDIEAAAEASHPSLRKGCAAAFTVEIDGEEQVVLAIEVDERAVAGAGRANGVVSAIRTAVSEQFQLPLHAVVLLKSRSIPKTSSGKIQRRACKAGFLDGSLDEVARDVATATPAADVAGLKAALRDAAPGEQARMLQDSIVQQIARFLAVPVDRVDTSRSVLGLGVDSIHAVELGMALEEHIGVEIPARVLVRASIVELVAEIVKALPKPSTPPAPDKHGLKVRPLPVDHAGEAVGRLIDGPSRELDAASTTLVLAAGGSHRGMDELLLTALATVLHDFCDAPWVRVDVAVPVDDPGGPAPSRGFTPAVVRATERPLRRALSSVRAQLLALPGGLAHGPISGAPTEGAEIALALRGESLATLPSHAIVLRTKIEAGKLRFAWSHSARYEPSTIAKLADRVLDVARSLAKEATSGEPLEYSAPLSAQEAAIFQWERDHPKTPLWNAPVILPLHGPLDVPALERAVSEIIRRHEILRTNFREVAGEPKQIIGAPWKFELPLTDLRGRSPEEADAEVTAAAGANNSTPFDLENGRLIRGRLFRTGDEAYVLLMGMHHIVFDGSSSHVMFSELLQHYAAFQAGSPSQLRDLPLQYADYSHMQQERLDDPARVGPLRAFWDKTLEGAAPIELPVDRPRTDALSLDAEAHRFMVDDATVTRLTEIGNEHGATFAMTLLAALKKVLHKYSGQSDLVVAMATGTRGEVPELSQLIGHFTDAVLVRTRIPNEAPRFTDFLTRVRDAAGEAYAHQALPLAMVLRSPQPIGHPLMRVLVNVHTFPGGVEPSAAGVTFSQALRRGRPYARAELSFTLMRRASIGVIGIMVASTKLFDSATGAKIAADFSAELAAIAAGSA